MPEPNTILSPSPLQNFVDTPYIKDLTQRALNYLYSGYSIHFRGPSGTGKTTLAKHVAAQLGRPMVMVHGDAEMSTSTLIGEENGYKMKSVRDSFISTVIKKEEVVAKNFVENRLTLACKHGFTFLYDEFNRSKPEANNVLLSVLEEGLLNLPMQFDDRDPYIEVHPDFRAIFTSNPEEYAGVHRSQDALRDRIITIDVDYFDYETELAITQTKSQLSQEDAALVVGVVRGLRKSGKSEFSPTVRGCIMIAKTLSVMKSSPLTDIKNFKTVCQDILASETSRVGSKTNQDRVKAVINGIVDQALAETLASEPSDTSASNSPKQNQHA